MPPTQRPASAAEAIVLRSDIRSSARISARKIQTWLNAAWPANGALEHPRVEREDVAPEERGERMHSEPVEEREAEEPVRTKPVRRKTLNPPMKPSSGWNARVTSDWIGWAMMIAVYQGIPSGAPFR